MKTAISILSALLSAAFAIPAPSNAELAPRAACTGNTASDRSVWCDHDINTNYYDEVPDTGVTREYWLELTNTTVAPDGVPRYGLAWNGSIPGPTIEADWGDTVVVHVINSVENNGTSIHFHGIRQNYTNPSDGVPSITQCPAAPGNSITYTWRATQYGSSWYHSHYSLQAWEGAHGPIVIHGPATANYDEDLGPLMLSDWNHQPIDMLFWRVETPLGAPVLDTGLINGANTWLNKTGHRWNTTLTPGKSYLMRLVNPSLDTHFDFSIDNHTLKVVAMDFVPIKPYETTVIALGVAQRYDVIVTANQEHVASDFWLRIIPDDFCSQSAHPDDIRGIIHYDNSTRTPSTTQWDQSIRAGACDQEPYASLVPHLSLDAGPSYKDLDFTVQIAAINQTIYRWFLGPNTMQVQFNDPTIVQVLNGNTSFVNASNVYQLDVANEWVYVIIETVFPFAHPIHLHGHDFYVLARGNGSFNAANTTLVTHNPPRRDVSMLPAMGYEVLAWKNDNPGIWLMHCHIGWHTSQGLVIQWVERLNEIPDVYRSNPGTSGVSDVCEPWDQYQAATNLVEYDSGV